MRLYALVSQQGTACAEIVLTEEEFTSEWRRKTEAQFCRGRADDPVAGTWTDVTDNEACHT